jgi:hypothetical protein
MYYRVTKSDTSSESIVLEEVIVTKPQNFSGIDNLLMMDENGVFNNDVLSFIGYRTPSSNFGVYTIPALYNETLMIQTTDGFISASSVYEDNGSGFVSEVPFIKYAVTAATGQFCGAEYVYIYINNVKKTRIVEVIG